MEKVTSKLGSFCVWTVVAALLSQNVVIHVISRSIEDEKNYYSPAPLTPDPHTPGGSHGSPPHGHTPSHGSGHGCGGSCHGTPSHGSGGSYNPTPSTPSTPSGGNCGTPSHGSGGSYNPTPSTPSTPSSPSGGGGYYNNPPTSPGGSPTTPTPITPIVGSPPDTPTTPITPFPGTPPATPPFIPDPNSPFIGTCNYWSTHPGVIWGLLGWWGTLSSAFGASSFPGLGANPSLQQALSNTRTDGLGELYREGTASLLNSMVNHKFPFTTTQVRDSFVSALSSNKAAAAQAHVFKLANEGRLKPRD